MGVMTRKKAQEDGSEKARRLAAVITRQRKAQGVTAYRLAEESGLSRSYLSHMEHGRFGELGLDKFARIVEALGVSADDLLRQAGYLSSKQADLPKIESYLAKTHRLSPEGIRRAVAFLEFLTEEERAATKTARRRKK